MSTPWSLLLAATVGFLGASCASTTADEAKCSRTTPDVVNAIQAKLTTDGTLRNSAIWREGSLTFVTAELHEPGDRDEEAGNLLTWATDDPAAGRFLAVDVYAREDSSWPEAEFDVREKGVIDSRACAALWAGDTDPAD